MTKTAQCNQCLKRITLVHPTKTRPLGRLRRHTNAIAGYGKGWLCHGLPKLDTVKEKK